METWSQHCQNSPSTPVPLSHSMALVMVYRITKSCSSDVAALLSSAAVVSPDLAGRWEGTADWAWPQLARMCGHERSRGQQHRLDPLDASVKTPSSVTQHRPFQTMREVAPPKARPLTPLRTPPAPPRGWQTRSGAWPAVPSDSPALEGLRFPPAPAPGIARAATRSDRAGVARSGASRAGPGYWLGWARGRRALLPAAASPRAGRTETSTATLPRGVAQRGGKKSMMAQANETAGLNHGGINQS